MYDSNLIFGKDKMERIVNISMKDDKVYIYIQEIDGSIKVHIEEYCPWVLSNKKINIRSEKLQGNQHYKYLTPTTCSKFIAAQKKFQKDLWLPRDLVETFTLAEGVTYHKGMKANEVSILSFDIETSGLVMDETSQVFLISNTLRSNNRVIRKLFSVDEYPNQREMITDWIDWVRKVDPSIMCGHNILSYDFPYIKHCYQDNLDLGRDQSPAEFSERESKFRKDGSQQYSYHNVRITGREIVDTFFLSIKYDIGRDFPSYGLKPIVKHLGLEKAGRTFIDASQIKTQWNDLAMREKIKQYAIEDSDDALKLFDLMIPAYFYLAQSVPKTLQQMINEAAGSQLDALMVRSYLQDGYSQPRTSAKVPFDGAISMGIPGVYEHVCKADIASLYPSVMLEYNIHDDKKDPYNHMIQMLSYFRDERLLNKKLAKETGDKYYDDMQNAQKIMINSLYGFMGSGFLLYNYPKGAAEVTRRGREILLKGVEWATGHTLERVVKDITNEGSDTEEISYEYVVGEKVCEGRGFSLVNVDTDSFSITKNQEITKEAFQTTLSDLNAEFPKLIEWQDDGIYNKVIVIRAKNYVLVRDGKVKFKGSAITDQKKEPALVEMLEKMIYALLDGEKAALPVIYREYIKEALNIQFINRWTAKKTITKSVLYPNRLTELKVLNAVKECVERKVIEGVSEGDKVWVYNSIKGEIQAKAKGELIFYKDGRPKMVPNYILRDMRLWEHDEDKHHYLDRVYSTVEILGNLLDMNQFVDYNKKSNAEQLKLLTSG